MKSYLLVLVLLWALMATQGVWGMDTVGAQPSSMIEVVQKQVDEKCIEAVKKGLDIADFFVIGDGERCGRGYKHTMPNLNYQDGEGKTCLHHAVLCKQNEKYLQSLLSRSANPLMRDKAGNLPVDYASDDNRVVLLSSMAQQACVQGDVSMLQKMLQEGVVISDEWLFDALSSKNIEIIKKLIAHGANPRAQKKDTARSKFGKLIESCQMGTLVHYAVQIKLPLEILHYCLELGVDVFARNKSGLTALDYALLAGDTQRVAILLPYYKGGQDNGRLLLSAVNAHIDAAYVSNLDALVATLNFTEKELCEAYLKLHTLLAEKAGFKEKHDAFLQRYNVPPVKQLPKSLMAEITQLQACKNLLAAKIGSDCTTLDSGVKQSAEQQQPAKPALDIVDYLGNTPLVYAVRNNDLNEVESLLKAGAQLQINKALFAAAEMPKTGMKCNPAMVNPYAVWLAQKQKIFDLLISNGADINAKDIHGDTLLHRAARDGECGAVGVLVNTYKANIYVCNMDGDTSAHIAVKNANADMVKAIVALESSIRSSMDVQTKLQHPKRLSQICNKDGKTPIVIATDMGKSDLVELLESENLIASWCVVNTLDEHKKQLSAESVQCALRPQLKDHDKTPHATLPAVLEDENEDPFSLAALRADDGKREKGKNKDAYGPDMYQNYDHTSDDDLSSDGDEEDEAIILEDKTPATASVADIVEQKEYRVKALEPIPAAAVRTPRIKVPVPHDQQADHFHALFASEDHLKIGTPQTGNNPDPKQRALALPIIATVAGIGLVCVVAKKVYDHFCASDTDALIKNQSDDEELDDTAGSATQPLQGTALLRQQ